MALSGSGEPSPRAGHGTAPSLPPDAIAEEGLLRRRPWSQALEAELREVTRVRRDAIERRRARLEGVHDDGGDDDGSDDDDGGARRDVDGAARDGGMVATSGDEVSGGGSDTGERGGGDDEMRRGDSGR